MPKKPNSEIRAALREIAATLRDLAATLDSQVEALHNAKPQKPRAPDKAPHITKRMAKNIRYLAMCGTSNADIAAVYKINQGRITDVLNGKYD
jgi:DNA-binding NarL/FixJ family response regulator